MKLSPKQTTEMLKAAKPLMKWLNENCHPHCKIILEDVSVELVEAVATKCTNEFIKD